MTFMNCFTQLNMDNSSGFYDISTPQVSFNMWNSMPLFNFDTGFKFPSFDFSILNIFNWNTNISWSNNLSFGDTFTRTSSSIGTSRSTLKLDGYNASAGR